MCRNLDLARVEIISDKCTKTRLLLSASSVVRAVQRHRTGVGSIPAKRPMIEEFFLTVPGRFLTCA